VPNSLNKNYVEAMEIASKISTTLTADKKEFMLNEPIKLKWNIANGSEFDVSVMLDENMGEESATEVWAVSEEGEVLLERERFGWRHSGPIHYKNIAPKSTVPYEIFLPDKFAIPKPGRYTVNVFRNLYVRRIEPPKDERDRRDWTEYERWTEVSVPIVASMTIDVVPNDPDKLGKQIYCNTSIN
jgi:hypothetical protein